MIWEAISKLELFPAFLWPPFIVPVEPGGVTIMKTFVNGLMSGQLINATLVSLQSLLLGFVISVVVGLVLGFLIYSSKWIEDTLGFVVTALQSVPNIVWLPLAILWFGLGFSSVLFIVVLGAALSITITSSSGFKSVPPIQIRAARTMGASGFQLFRTIIFPSSVPHIISGLRLAWALAWRAVLAGELLGGGGGLGTLLDMGRSIQAMDLVFSIMIIIGVIGTLIDHVVFLQLEKAVLKRWRLQSNTA